MGKGPRLNLFSSSLYKQRVRLAAVRAQTVTSHKPSANLYVIWKVERIGGVCELLSLKHPIRVSLMQSSAFPVFTGFGVCQWVMG